MKVCRFMLLAVCLSVFALAGEAFGLEWHQASVPEPTSFARFAVAPDGSLYLASRNFLSRWNGSTWETETIPDMSTTSDTQVGSVDLVFSPDGRPNLLYTYAYGTNVVFCTKSDGIWKKESLFQNQAGGAMRANMAIDSTGKVYIAAIFGKAGISETLHLMTRTPDGTWSETLVDDSYRAAWWPDIEVTNDNTVHIAYTTGQTDDMKYAVYKNGSWSFQVLESAGHTGYEPSLKLTPAGLARMSYFNVDERLCYLQVENSPGSFTRYPVGTTQAEVCDVNLMADGTPLATYVEYDQATYTGSVQCAILQNGTVKHCDMGGTTIGGTVYSDYFSAITANGNLYVYSYGDTMWWASLNDLPVTISGRITDQYSGAGVSGATVYISQTPNPSTSPSYTVVADAQGKYSQTISAGTWYVTATKDGYKPSGESAVNACVGGSPVLNIPMTFIPPIKTDVFYRFDEADGTTAADSSGFGKNGTLVNGPTWAQGELDNSLSFDGLDDFVSVPDLDEYTSITVSAWINLDSLGTDATGSAILACDGADSGDVQLLLKPDGRLQFILPGNSPADPASNYAFTSTALGRWKHVAMVYDSAAKTVRFYINGKLDATRTLNTTRTASLTGGVRIGGWSGGRYLDGRVDEFHIYGHALSATEIATLVSDSSSVKIGKAKQMADGAFVTLVDKIVVYAPRNASFARTTRFFYVEEPDRTAGLLVYNVPSTQDNLAVDTVVTLAGMMKTINYTGQRYLALTAAPSAGVTNAIAPLGMTTKSVQKDPSTLGLYVRVAGKIKEMSEGKDWFTMVDGYGVATFVISETQIPFDGLAVGDTVAVTGVVGTDVVFGDAPEGIVYPRTVVKL